MKLPSAKSARTLDLLAFVALACLFAKGYLRFRGYHLETGLLSAVSFVGVFYAFRVHTRFLWIIGAPIVVTVMPVFGRDILSHLSHAPGKETYASIREPIELLFFYNGFLFCWLLMRRLGWNLNADETSPRRTQTSLQELMAITAVVAALLFCCKHSVRITQFSLPDHGTETFLAILGAFFVYGGLIAGFMSNRLRWIVIFSLASFTATIAPWWLNNATWIQYYVKTHQDAYSTALIAHFAESSKPIVLPIIIISIAFASGRCAGYRIQRTTGGAQRSPATSPQRPSAT